MGKKPIWCWIVLAFLICLAAAATIVLVVLPNMLQADIPDDLETIVVPEPTPCAHKWEHGVCVLCGKQCQHEYRSGVCEICGQACPHRWSKGVCERCGLICSHEHHDAETLLCSECGERVYHHMVNAECLLCGQKPAFYEDFLPEEYYEECDQKGKILTFNYGTSLSGYSAGTVKGAKIYIPYGYDEYDKETRYDVLIVIHGMGGSENDIIGATFAAGGKYICMKTIYDRMIMEGKCKPLIIVGICTYAYMGEEYNDTGNKQIAKELRDVILPYIVNHFNTYAEDGSPESIKAARQHFAIGGFSNGSLYSLSAGMVQNFDLFGSYACFSGNNCAADVVKTLNAEEYQNLPIYCFFTGAGLHEGQHRNSSLGFAAIVEGCDRLTEGENAFYVGVDSGHDWKAWSTDLYNALLVMFQDVG